MDAHTAVNQKIWDELAPLHAASDFYDVDALLRGEDQLGAIESTEVGVEVAGKRMVHLMCHIGLDTLSWARRGAHVTGVDFSPAALEIARQLADQLSSEAHFVCSDVLQAANELAETFDIVFLSKGIMMWIQDVGAWARACADLLAPGGVFYLLDYHPLANAVTQSGDELRVQASYFHSSQPAVVVKDGSYAVSDAGMENQESREWTHTLADIVTALIQAGIDIEFLHEFPAAAADMPIPQLDAEPVRNTLPAMFSIRGIRRTS